MPLFDYVCEKCGKEKNELVKNADEEVFCECGEQMKRLFPLSNFYLKGQGWANTGYAKKNTPKSNG